MPIAVQEIANECQLTVTSRRLGNPEHRSPLALFGNSSVRREPIPVCIRRPLTQLYERLRTTGLFYKS
jgi:hypothetical protein